MLEAFEILKNETNSNLSMCLTFDERQKSRYKTTTQCGVAVGWFIERGRILQAGDYLKCKTGEIIQILAAPEKVSQITSHNALLLMRIAYHLGNRHVPLQITQHELCYQQDYVLDDMVKGLGVPVIHAEKPFQPEAGAYQASATQHSFILQPHRH